MIPRTRLALVLIAVAGGVRSAIVGCQAGQALVALEGVERERDTWQRPQDIIGALDLQPGESSSMWDRAPAISRFGLRRSSAAAAG